MLRWARGRGQPCACFTRDNNEFVKQQWASLDPRTDSEGVRGLLCGMRGGPEWAGLSPTRVSLTNLLYRIAHTDYKEAIHIYDIHYLSILLDGEMRGGPRSCAGSGPRAGSDPTLLHLVYYYHYYYHYHCC